MQKQEPVVVVIAGVSLPDVACKMRARLTSKVCANLSVDQCIQMYVGLRRLLPICKEKIKKEVEKRNVTRSGRAREHGRSRP